MHDYTRIVKFQFTVQYSLGLPFLHLTPPTEGFPWDDLRKIFGGCQRMAKIPNGVEKLRKILID